ncbi:MAG: efflux RND transporter periplasmic adaptor subunit [Gammaproteobacteria bacterium]|nr:efflux RND transporter periplasmic adaptor subunit [Gammaproteobacteria bacterium]
MLKRHRLLIISLSVIILLAGFIAYVKRPQPVAVVVHKVATGEVLSTVANTRAGTLKACRRASLSPSIGGQIESLPVKEGDQVEAGQLLLEIWNDDLQAQVKLAQHEYQAALARSREACIVADVARREASRLHKLHKQKLASEESVDKARGEANARLAACDAVNTSVKVSQARIDVAEAALNRTRLIAPFKGKVAEVNGELGEYLTPSPMGIATLPAVDLIDYTCLYVSAPIDEVDAPNIKPEMPVHISLDAFSKQIFQGQIRRVASYVLDIEKQARTVEVEAVFSNPQEAELMLPGYSADVEVILNRKQNVIRIPTTALLEGNKVMIFTADNLIEERQIETGMSNWSYTEVINGIDINEQVIVSVERDGVENGASAKIESTSD